MTKPSQADLDEKVRALLSERGDSSSVPRPVSFFFYGGNHAELQAAAIRAGYVAGPTANNDGVVLETVTAVDQDNFPKHTSRMERWAEEFSCEYDGWECQVITQ